MECAGRAERRRRFGLQIQSGVALRLHRTPRQAMQFGDHRVEIVPDSEFRLDGAAMFGVVPRALWSRVSPSDHQNRMMVCFWHVFQSKEEIPARM